MFIAFLVCVSLFCPLCLIVLFVALFVLRCFFLCVLCVSVRVCLEEELLLSFFKCENMWESEGGEK